MFCEQCGAEVTTQKRFCTKCGASVAAPPSPLPKAATKRRTTLYAAVVAGLLLMVFALFLRTEHGVPGTLGSLSFLSRGGTRGSDYFPMRVGLQWEYSTKYTPQSGQAQVSQSLVRIDGIEMISGKPYYRFQNIDNQGRQRIAFYRRIATEGVWQIDGTNKDSPEYLDYRFPLAAGVSWTVNKPSGGATQFRVEGFENLELENKTYRNCAHLSYTQGEVEGMFYLAPNVGSVKSSWRRRGGDSLQMELKAFNVSSPLAPGPSDVVKKFYFACNDNKYSEAESLLSADSQRLIHSERVTAIGGLRKICEEGSRNGNLTQVEVISEGIKGEGATVVVNLHFKDGSIKKDDEKLIKESGSWKLAPD